MGSPRPQVRVSVFGHPSRYARSRPLPYGAWGSFERRIRIPPAFGRQKAWYAAGLVFTAEMTSSSGERPRRWLTDGADSTPYKTSDIFRHSRVGNHNQTTVQKPKGLRSRYAMSLGAESVAGPSREKPRKWKGEGGWQAPAWCLPEMLFVTPLIVPDPLSNPIFGVHRSMCGDALGVSESRVIRGVRKAAGTMRGTGFEPADPYGTAPSTLRRWPGLATHARCRTACWRIRRLGISAFVFATKADVSIQSPVNRRHGQILHR